MKCYCLLLFFVVTVLAAKGQRVNVEALRQALASAKNDTTRVNKLFELSMAYVFFNADSMEKFAKEGLQLAQRVDYKSGQARCMMNLCLALNSSGNYTDALRYGLKASPLVTEMRDSFLMIWNNVQIMTCYNSLEDYDQAIAYGNKARRLFRRARQDPNQVSVTLGVLGSAYEKKNQLDSALYYEQKAMSFDSSWTALFTSIGNAYLKKGRADSALSYFTRGLAVAGKESNLYAPVELYTNISKVFEGLDRVDSSLAYAKRAMQQVSGQSNPAGLLTAAAQLAHLYGRLKMQDSTVKYLALTNTLKDSIYSRRKTREAQGFAFNERLHEQELLMQHRDDENKTKLIVLLVAVSAILLIAFFLWRNNRQKQKTNEELNKAYHQLKAAQAQLIQAEKMASLGELTAGIAHEIQNPLNFVNNFSETNSELLAELKQEAARGNTGEVLALAEDLTQNQEKITHHGKRADSIVKNMLQHASGYAREKQATDINKLIDECLRLSYRNFEAKDKDCNVQILTYLGSTVGEVAMVPQEIGKVLVNLLNNAFYAVAEKKKRLNDRYEPVVLVSSTRSSEAITITVKDNGPGMPARTVEKIFQPFFTTKPTGEGTGLGLSLSYDIITKGHGGTLSVQSKEGEGSEFAVTLPVG